MRKIILFLLLFSWTFAQTGMLRVGFDIDDTVLYSEPAFQKALKDGNGQIDYGWINTHDREYSIPISPTVELISFFRAHGHEVYFITARSGDNGQHLAEYLTDLLGFPVEMGKVLFFSPKEKKNGFSYTTKHKIMKTLDLDIFYGDSDQDVIAAIKADVHPVRVVRNGQSIEAYGNNYFGNTHDGKSAAAPFSAEDLKFFYRGSVGVFGESIYPIVWIGPGE